MNVWHVVSAGYAGFGKGVPSVWLMDIAMKRARKSNIGGISCA